MKHTVNLRDLELIERVHARGGRFRYYPLLSGNDGEKGNFFLQLSYIYDDFESPRHRHNFDQIRFQLEGDVDFARDGVMTPGTVGYFPEGAYYGPQSCKGASVTLVLQFGGASGSGYLSEAEFQSGINQLKEVGRFENGIFKRQQADGSVKSQDAYEAVWEHRNQKRLEYPESRYDRSIFMRPDAARWRPVESIKGASKKHLGTFSEALCEVFMVRLTAGSYFPVAPRTIAFATSGTGAASQGNWERWSTLYSDDAAGRIEARDDSELLVIQLPSIFEEAMQ